MTPKEKQILSVIAAIVILAGGYVWAVKYRQTPTPQNQTQQQTQMQDETANWKTYKNNKYGFEIKYPSDWKVNVQNENANLQDPVIFQVGNIYYGSVDISFGTLEHATANDSGWTYKNKTETLGGKQVAAAEASFQNRLKEKIYEIKLDKDTTVVIAQLADNYETYTYDQKWKLINIILSTFKFTKSDESVNWKTYKNDTYGFEIGYPGNWSVNPQKETKTALHVAFSTDFVKVGELAALNVFTSDKDLEDSYGYILNQGSKSFQSEEINGLTVSETSSKDDNGTVFYFFFKKNGVDYALVTSQTRDGQSMLDIATRMLSTFKFTK